MPISGRQTNTMEEFVQKFLRLITDAKTAEDADLPFLVNLETQLLQYVKAPMAQAGVDTSQMQGGFPPPNPQTGGAGGVMGGGFAPTPGQGVPGVQSGPTAPNPDELRRLLTWQRLPQVNNQ